MDKSLETIKMSFEKLDPPEKSYIKTIETVIEYLPQIEQVLQVNSTKYQWKEKSNLYKQFQRIQKRKHSLGSSEINKIMILKIDKNHIRKKIYVSI